MAAFAIVLLVVAGAALTGAVGAVWHVRRRVTAVPRPPKIVVRDGAFVELAAELTPQMPLPDDIVAAVDGLRGSATGAKDDPFKADLAKAGGFGAAAIDGAIPGIALWASWESMDDAIFKGFSHMTNQAVDGFGDLLKAIDANEYLVTANAFKNSLAGHVGEWQAFQQLTDAGADVQMPEAGNEPGLDMWVNGDPINIKLVDNAGQAASAHFSDYPDIPIMVPSDATNIPEDAIHFDPTEGLDPELVLRGDNLVLVNDALSHAETFQQTADAMDAADAPSPDAGIPVVTLAMSTFREGRLLFNGSTSAGRMVKNVAVDTAAVGGMGFAGGKIGAAIGTFIAPGIGTAVGAAIGGILGALGGKGIANEIRLAPLRAAKETLETTQKAYLQAESEAAEMAGSKWATARTEEQQAYSTELERLREEHQQVVARLRTSASSATRIPRAHAQRCLAQLTANLDRIATLVARKAPESMPAPLRPLARHWAPEASKEAQQFALEVNGWKALAADAMENWDDSQAATDRFFDLVLAVPGGTKVAAQFMNGAVRTRTAIYSNLIGTASKALESLVSARKAAVVRLKKRWEAIEHEVEKILRGPRTELKRAVSSFKKELAAAGIEDKA